MVKDIYDPLSEYINVFRPRFNDVAEATFAELAKEARVDEAANRETCRQLQTTNENVSSVKRSIRWRVFWCVVLWIAVAVGVVVLLTVYEPWTPLVGVGMLLAAVLLIAKLHPTIKRLKKERRSLEEQAQQLQQTAWQQMEPLNRLYDWDILTRMMSKTVPRLEFDPFFTEQRLVDLWHTYQWDGHLGNDESAIYSHSGLINGNPFVLCRIRNMEMGTKTYEGTKTIYWTTRERGSDGKYHTVSHSQILIATVTEPYPYYHERTRLIYGNTAAPDLIFTRKKSGLASKEGSFSYNRKRRSLRRKANNLETADYAMMTNEEFEVAFDTSNRNNNQQFALLFSPLAQESMLKLLQDHEAGYGDDFDFLKHKMINTIVPDHLQQMELDTDPKVYRSYNFDQAKADFKTKNAESFRAIYFALAPLLCVPMYQQIRSHEDIYGRELPLRSCAWEHESLANHYGEDHFAAKNCVTRCILKTETTSRNSDNTATIKVIANGHRSERRLTYVSVYGRDGRWHKVPVEWDEYFPVTGYGNMHIKEDHNFDQEVGTAAERRKHVDEMLTASHLTRYRRHIASRVD